MTPAFAAYIAPAQPRAEPWRTLLGFLLIILVYFGTMAGMAGLVWALSSLDALEAGLRRLGEGEDSLAMLILLATFLGGWLGVWLVVRLLHRRPMATLFGHPPRVLADFVLGTVALVVVGGGLGLLALPWLPALEPALPPAAWLLLLPVALVAVLIQTGAEELVFRAYLQQQLAARFASPLVWMLIPSALFGLAHFSPEQNGSATWLVVAATGLFGLIAADLTARSGNLGLAWGLHFANNVLAILVVSAMPGMDGLALFRLSERSAEILVPLLVFDMALLVAVWAACRFALSRR
jgi:membrane protease YdiL (CAAX protease family)